MAAVISHVSACFKLRDALAARVLAMTYLKNLIIVLALLAWGGATAQETSVPQAPVSNSSGSEYIIGPGDSLQSQLGRSLRIPNVVSNARHNADTFTPH